MPTDPQWYILLTQGGSFVILCILLLYYLPRIARLVHKDYHQQRAEHSKERSEWHAAMERWQARLVIALEGIAQALDRLTAGPARPGPGRRGPAAPPAGEPRQPNASGPEDAPC